MQYKHVHRPLREMPRTRSRWHFGRLGGRSGNRIHLTAQLIYAASDTHVWAESFECDLSDVNSLQNELAQTIAKQVGATTSGLRYSGHRYRPEGSRCVPFRTLLLFAYENERSTEYFRKAIDLQPDYAAAWSGLADSYALSAALGRVPPDAVMPQAEAAAKKALELDDLSAEAHNTMAALYLAYRWNWIAAERESLRALELNPNLGEAHHLYAKVLVAFNRTDEELEEEKTGDGIGSIRQTLGAGGIAAQCTSV